MKRTSLFLRCACFFIDLLLVMVPVQALTLWLLHMELAQAQTYFTLLLAIYGTVTASAFGGVTAGKFFGKLVILDRDGSEAPLLYLGLRELTKGMYLLPLAGPVLLLTSLVLYAIKGTTLHDIVGRTQVVYRRQAQAIRTVREEAQHA